jgi:hypothetical protein
MKDFYFDAGLDPNYRIAGNAGQLDGQTAMARLSRFAAHYGIEGEFDGVFLCSVSKDAKEKEGMLLGASILRDCYGKINYFFMPTDSPYFSGIAKVLKAYKKTIRVIGVARDDVPVDLKYDELDEVMRISEKDTVSVSEKAKDLEGFTPGPASAAVLLAAKERALLMKDKHARYVLVFADV